MPVLIARPDWVNRLKSLDLPNILKQVADMTLALVIAILLAISTIASFTVDLAPEGDERSMSR